LKRYFTGKECARGHITEKYINKYLCVVCSKEDNGKKDPQYFKEYRLKNKDRSKKYRDEYYLKNKDDILIKKTEYRKRPEVIKMRKGYSATDESKRKREEYASKPENKEKRKKYIKKWQSDFRKTEKGAIITSMRVMLKRVVSNKTDRTEAMLGYTQEEFRAHMEKQFSSGMNWTNWGDWHVDHITPVSKFVNDGIIDPKIINALPNLQPLWAIDNMTKSDSITKLI